MNTMARCVQVHDSFDKKLGSNCFLEFCQDADMMWFLLQGNKDWILHQTKWNLFGGEKLNTKKQKGLPAQNVIKYWNTSHC